MPGIGRKTAERLAYHVLRASDEEAMGLANAISDVKKRTKHCSICFNIADTDPCPICTDKRRDQSLICVVEQPKDMIAIENSGRYNGVYHVLMGHLAPLEGIEPEHLTVKQLVERVRNNDIKEVIIATNPTMEGDTTALYIAKELQGLNVQVTRIARGMPAGSNIEYVNAAILSDALDGRREMK